MNFSSLAEGNPFYILRKGDKPMLEVGIVKSKSIPQAKYQAQAVANAFTGTNVQNVVSIVVSVGGKEETFSDVPSNVEIAAKGNDTFSGSREAMLQVIDSVVQTSKKALDMVSYHNFVLKESERWLETLNPRYAEEKRQARTITDLEKRQTETDKKIDSILSILQKLDNPSPTK